MPHVSPFGIFITVCLIYAVYVLISTLRAAYETIDILTAENNQLREATKIVADYEDVAVIDAKN